MDLKGETPIIFKQKKGNAIKKKVEETREGNEGNWEDYNCNANNKEWDMMTQNNNKEQNNNKTNVGIATDASYEHKNNKIFIIITIEQQCV